MASQKAAHKVRNWFGAQTRTRRVGTRCVRARYPAKPQGSAEGSAGLQAPGTENTQLLALPDSVSFSHFTVELYHFFPRVLVQMHHIFDEAFAPVGEYEGWPVSRDAEWSQLVRVPASDVRTLKTPTAKSNSLAQAQDCVQVQAVRGSGHERQESRVLEAEEPRYGTKAGLRTRIETGLFCNALEKRGRWHWGTP